jgi:solute carrier family 35 protein
MPTLKMTLLCWSFGACSLAMNVLNKVLVTNLKSPALLTAAQMFMTLIGTLILVRHRLTGTTTQCLKWCFVPLLFCGMLLSSFLTYEYLTLSLLMIIRNVGPLVTLPIEYFIMPTDKCPYVTRRMIIALLVVLASTFLYVEGISVSSWGILFAVLNMLLAIADRVAQRRLLTTECKDLSLETCMFLNNSVGMVPILGFALATGEMNVFDTGALFSNMTTVLLVLYGVIGTGICYFALAVQREITATSFMVVQNAVRMAVVLFGIFCFADPIGWPYQVIGLVLSFVGTFAYGLAQLQALAEIKARKAAQDHAMESSKPSKK